MKSLSSSVWHFEVAQKSIKLHISFCRQQSAGVIRLQVYSRIMLHVTLRPLFSQSCASVWDTGLVSKAQYADLIIGHLVHLWSKKSSHTYPYKRRISNITDPSGAGSVNIQHCSSLRAVVVLPPAV